MPRKKKEPIVEIEKIEDAEIIVPEVPDIETRPGRKIVFSSDREKFGDPPATVQIGLLKIDMPPAEEQLAGFEHEFASEIRKSVRGFKWAQAKGDKR